MDWTMENDAPEIMTWEARTGNGSRLVVSSGYIGSYAWSVFDSRGWRVTGGYGESILDAQRKAEQAAARNGL